MPPKQDINCIPLQFTIGTAADCRHPDTFIGDDLEFVRNLGSTFFPAEAWQHLSDEEILRLSEQEMHSHGTEISLLGKEIREMLRKWAPMLIPADQPYDSKWMDLWIVLTAGARMSLAEECERRLSARDNAQTSEMADWRLPRAV
jgi:hypothetical protein